MALLWVVPVLDDAGESPAAVTSAFAVDVTDTGQRRGAGWQSTPVPADGAVMVGADWGGGHQVVEVRASRDGTWGPWYAFDTHVEHGPDVGTDEDERSVAMSEPVWTGPADLFQFRSSAPLPRLDVSTVAMVGGGGLEWTPDAAGNGAAQALAARPAIRTRASWGADESFRNDDPKVHQDARFAIIHHVGGGNWPEGDIENGCAYADDWIRGIYAYHTNSRNYDDIAYNFVVDPCGNVWEGRTGGVENAVQGAHASGFNQGSVGVLALGTFSGDTPDPVTPELLNGITRLLAWKFDVHHVDPDGTTTEIAGGGGSSRYDDGDLVVLPVISAHQVQNATSCPGNDLMAALFDGVNAEATPQEGFVDDVRSRGLPKAFGGPSAAWQAGDTPDGNEHLEPLDPERPVWDVEFTRRLDWRLEITDDDGAVVRATGGSDERRLERTWDLRNEDGEPVRAGNYTATLTATVSGGDGEVRPVVTDLDVRSPIGRVAGDTRVATAVELSQEAFDAADEVVLASADAYPDALVASPLAASLAAPVLLTPKDALADEVADEIERLGATSVRVVGGPVAVSNDVTDALVDRDLEVVRYAGRTRFDTAARVAAAVTEREGGGEVLVAVGQHADPARAFPDALAAGAFGALTGSPVLLVGDGELPDDTADALADLTPEDVLLFGGTVAIDTRLERRIGRAADGATVARLAGADRFDTAALAAVEIVERAPWPVEDDGPPDTATRNASEEPTEEPSESATEDDASDPPTPRPILLASGRNWPDALGAGAATAALRGIFLLVDDDDLDESQATADFLEAHTGHVARLLIAGGPVAIDSDVVLALAELSLGEHIEVGEPIAWPRDPNEEPEPAPTATESETEDGGIALPLPGASESSSSESASASPSDDATASEDPTASEEPTASESASDPDPDPTPT